MAQDIIDQLSSLVSEFITRTTAKVRKDFREILITILILHPGRIRALTIRLSFRASGKQGETTARKRSPQYTLVGNAVPPLMARAIANTLLQHIK